MAYRSKSVSGKKVAIGLAAICVAITALLLGIFRLTERRLTGMDKPGYRPAAERGAATQTSGYLGD